MDCSARCFLSSVEGSKVRSCRIEGRGEVSEEFVHAQRVEVELQAF